MSASLLLAAEGMTPAARFDELAARWEADTRFYSDNERLILHPAYQQIIGMGPAVLPLILDRLASRGGQWFWALTAITGEDPVPAAAAGAYERAREAWLRWGRDAGLLTDS